MITDLQLDIAALILGHEPLGKVTVDTISVTGDAQVTTVLEKLNKSLSGLRKRNGAAGIGIIIPLPSFRVKNQDAPGPQGAIEVSVQVLENTLVNAGSSGTGLTAFDVAAEVMSMLHLYSLDGIHTLYCAEDGIQPLAISSADNLSADVAYEVLFSQHVAIRPIVRSAGVTATVSLTELILTAPGADEIRYTLDGTLPTADNGTVFAAPLPPLANGQTLRAVSLTDGRMQSPIFQLKN